MNRRATNHIKKNAFKTQYACVCVYAMRVVVWCVVDCHVTILYGNIFFLVRSFVTFSDGYLPKHWRQENANVTNVHGNVEQM